jgi:hypothetical protein
VGRIARLDREQHGKFCGLGVRMFICGARHRLRPLVEVALSALEAALEYCHASLIFGDCSRAQWTVEAEPSLFESLSDRDF